MRSFHVPKCPVRYAELPRLICRSRGAGASSLNMNSHLGPHADLCVCKDLYAFGLRGDASWDKYQGHACISRREQLGRTNTQAHRHAPPASGQLEGSVTVGTCHMKNGYWWKKNLLGFFMRQVPSMSSSAMVADHG